MKGQTHIILALIFALIVAVFAVINVDPVEVNYLFGTGQAPLVLVILVSVLMGGLITGAFGIFRLLKLQKQLRVLEKENTRLQPNQDSNIETELDRKENTIQEDNNTDNRPND